MRRMIWYLEGEGPPVDVPDTGIGPLCETVLLCVLLGVQRGSPRPAGAAHHAGLDGAVSGAPAAPPHTGLLPSRCSVRAESGWPGTASVRFLGNWNRPASPAGSCPCGIHCRLPPLNLSIVGGIRYA